MLPKPTLCSESSMADLTKHYHTLGVNICLVHYSFICLLGSISQYIGHFFKTLHTVSTQRSVWAKLWIIFHCFHEFFSHFSCTLHDYMLFTKLLNLSSKPNLIKNNNWKLKKTPIFYTVIGLLQYIPNTKNEILSKQLDVAEHRC